MEAKIKYLQRLAKRWGGSIHLVDLNTYDNLSAALSQAPFNAFHAVDFRKREIYAVDEYVCVTTLIHEMGHVFATPHHPNNKHCDELTWLGWEYLLARRIGVARQWKHNNRSYGLGYLADSQDFDDLEPPQLQAVLKKAVRLAKRCRIIQGTRLLPHPKRIKDS